MWQKLLLACAPVGALLFIACSSSSTTTQTPSASGDTDSGTPPGTDDGDGDDAGKVPTGQVVCTSGKKWSSPERGVKMNPGLACIACHSSTTKEGPILQIGGTVFPTFNEEDYCYGIDGTKDDVKVVITDADGTEHELPVGPTGNFSALVTDATIKMPIHAKVVANGQERVMQAEQTTGDCNSCHTEKGKNGAPGRITTP
ncbi:hypothetical protein AKJ09_10238 [Labilithrix luteola]|uniref:Uncharacterized protein n=1 Tax=Labilithrix luteola TaxID=1391654 RepID=A0A0K1QDR3_9BACT|nr:hypothetical protein [Labilithrix luteola]AKV03575.1 hypothetical protein AKJ09_10238 [Labilithrix luteola]